MLAFTTRYLITTPCLVFCLNFFEKNNFLRQNHSVVYAKYHNICSEKDLVHKQYAMSTYNKNINMSINMNITRRKQNHYETHYFHRRTVS